MLIEVNWVEVLPGQVPSSLKRGHILKETVRYLHFPAREGQGADHSISGGLEDIQAFQIDILFLDVNHNTREMGCGNEKEYR